MKKLKDVMPREFSMSDSSMNRAQKFSDIGVIREFDATKAGESWPGTHKNVFFWVALENGFAVGWNENPGRGWSFPVVRFSKETSQVVKK